MISNTDLLWAVLRLFVALPIVLILAYLLIKYGLSRRYAVVGGSKNRMRVIEQLPLGTKTVLSLVALGDRYYLLAHQDNAIQFIKEFDQLPSLDKAVTGDVVELIPRSVLDLDQNGEAAARNPATELEAAKNSGIFADLPQKGKTLYAVGRDYMERIRFRAGPKDKSKR